jgi:signal peptidase
VPAGDNQPPIAPPAPSSAELERLRKHSIQVLGSVAAALEAAALQRQSLLADVRAAELVLQELAAERERAEAGLAATRAQLYEEAAQLAEARGQRVSILSDVESALTAGLERRVAMNAEVAILERRRDELTTTVAGLPVVASVPSDFSQHATGPPVAVPYASWPALIGTVLSRLQGRLRLARRPLHPIFSRLSALALIALLFALVVLLTPLTQLFGGLQLLAVTTGSMEPTIPVGAIVAIRPVPASDLKVGDAITFVNRSNPDVLITHRIVSLELSAGQTMLTTKGDANNTVDAQSGPASRTIGRVEFALPWLGYLMVWLGSPVAKIGIVGLAILGMGLTSLQRLSDSTSPRRRLPVHRAQAPNRITL